MSGSNSAGGGEAADVPSEELSRLQQLESEVEARCALMLEDARRRAAEIVQQAEQDVERLRSAQATRDREIFKAISDRVLSMGDAYREAMIGARQAVVQVAELARQANAPGDVTSTGEPVSSREAVSSGEAGAPDRPPLVDDAATDSRVLPG